MTASPVPALNFNGFNSNATARTLMKKDRSIFQESVHNQIADDSKEPSIWESLSDDYAVS